jgi:hypothetical protein
MKRTTEVLYSKHQDAHKRTKDDIGGTPFADPNDASLIVLYTFSVKENGDRAYGPCSRPSEAVTFIRRSCLSVRRQLGQRARIVVVTETPEHIGALLEPFGVRTWTLDSAWSSMTQCMPSHAHALRGGPAAPAEDIFETIGHARVWLLPLLRVLQPRATVLYMDDDAGIESDRAAADLIAGYSGPPLAYEVERGTSVRQALLPHIHVSDADATGSRELVNNGAILMTPTQESTDAFEEVLARYAEMKNKWGHVMYWDMIALTAVWHARELKTIREAKLPIIHLYQNKYRPDLTGKMLSRLGQWRRELDEALVQWLQQNGKPERAEKIRKWSQEFFEKDWPAHIIAAADMPVHMERVNVRRLMRSRRMTS